MFDERFLTVAAHDEPRQRSTRMRRAKVLNCVATELMRAVARLSLFGLVLAPMSCDSHPTNSTVLLGITENLNWKCVGHASDLCGPEKVTISTQAAGVFASEPSCKGLRLRGLTEVERTVPSNKLPLLFELFYQGTPHAQSYMGTGKAKTKDGCLRSTVPKGTSQAM
jgi:hypothetical protein